MFTPVGHSFASLIDKYLLRKATLLFQDVLLLELFQQTYRQSEGYIEREKEGGDINWRTKFHW